VSARQLAEDYLAHYFKTVFEAAGLLWISDNAAEMGVIVDALHEMVRDEIRAHAENAPHLYADGSTG
jgi:hypothetical protein